MLPERPGTEGSNTKTIPTPTGHAMIANSTLRDPIRVKSITGKLEVPITAPSLQGLRLSIQLRGVKGATHGGQALVLPNAR